MDGDLLVFGGRSRANLERWPAWNAFEAGILLRIRGGSVVDCLEYNGSGLEESVGVSTCFKASSVIGDAALTCTNTEVLKIDLNTFSIIEHWSHQYFNDLHHVAVIQDRIYVVSTGIDSVLAFDSKMNLVDRFALGSDQIIKRFGESADFRLIPSTKPHEVHPNFVGAWKGSIWCTALIGGRVCQLEGNETFRVADAPIHDGIPAFGRVWFTSVKGLIIRLDPEVGSLDVVDLNAITKSTGLLGWCRGIAPISVNRAIAGFTKLRGTVHRENVSWLDMSVMKIKNAMRLATHLSCYDLSRKQEEWRIYLSNYGMDAVFSVHIEAGSNLSG